MKPDSFTRTEQAAGEHAALLGRIEDFGGGGDDSVPGFDERYLCQICEHGHHGHICRWCIADGRTP